MLKEPLAIEAIADQHFNGNALIGSMTSGGKGLALDPIVWSKGFLNLVLALVEFAIPFVLIFAALFPQSFRRVAPVMPESDRMNLRLLEVAMLAAVTMMLAAVFFVGSLRIGKLRSSDSANFLL